MSYCDESIELISAVLDGALSPEEQAKLEAHLAQCPDCKALYEDLSRIHQSLLDLPPVEIPEGLTGRIMDAVAAEAARPKVVPLPQPKRSARPWQRWAVTAAAVAVVILGARTMQTNKSADESIIAPAQALPSPLASAESGLRTYSDENTVPESDAAGLDSTEAANDIFSVQTQGAETAQASPEPTAEVITDRAAPRPDPTPAPEPSAVPEAPVSSGSVTPRMAVSQKTSAVPAATSEPAAGEEPDEPQAGEVISPNVFVAQVLPSEEPSLLPEGMDCESGETAVPNDVLLTSIGNDLISEDDEPEETLPLTPQEALDVLLKAHPMPEDAQIVDTEDFLGWQTPYCGEPDSQQVSTRLQYRGLTEKDYHEFCLYSSFIDFPGDEDRQSILNFYAVPIGGGEVLVERQEVEGDLHDEDVWNTYLAGMDAYREAIGYLETSVPGEETPPPSEVPQP
ncbi:MAG: zf-HC2 domain-containing protein [Oscillospiraceae bacterium]|nr:zf-HC2 domain-containing protein [Oscillospiraceae bacterium]